MKTFLLLSLALWSTNILAQTRPLSEVTIMTCTTDSAIDLSVVRARLPLGGQDLYIKLRSAQKAIYQNLKIARSLGGKLTMYDANDFTLNYYAPSTHKQPIIESKLNPNIWFQCQIVEEPI